MIELRVGGKIELVLDANPSTGYLWEVATPDITVVKQDGEAQFKPDSKAIGTGGKMTFHFEAVAPGEEILRLIYHRPFEQDVPPLRTIEVYILVRQRRLASSGRFGIRGCACAPLGGARQW